MASKEAVQAVLNHVADCVATGRYDDGAGGVDEQALCEDLRSELSVIDIDLDA